MEEVRGEKTLRFALGEDTAQGYGVLYKQEHRNINFSDLYPETAAGVLVTF